MVWFVVVEEVGGVKKTVCYNCSKVIDVVDAFCAGDVPWLFCSDECYRAYMRLKDWKEKI